MFKDDNKEAPKMEVVKSVIKDPTALTALEFYDKYKADNVTVGDMMVLFAKYHCENQARAINSGEVVPIEIDKLYPLDDKIKAL